MTVIYQNTRRVAVDLRDNSEAIQAAKALARRLGRSIVVTNSETGERWDIPFTPEAEN